MKKHSVAARIEQRPLLRPDWPPDGATVVVRGGIDTREKLRRHAMRAAKVWSLDGRPFHGVSVFAVLGSTLEELLRQRFARFRAIYTPTVARLAQRGFDLLPTGRRPHFTVVLLDGGDDELDRLLAALGSARPNPEYSGDVVWQGGS